MNIDKNYVKCDVCGNSILIDQFGNGESCLNCGWKQSEESFENPNIAGIRNIPSLNNAKQQYLNGKPATLANFNDFVEAYERYGEVEFTYNNMRYGVLFDDETQKIKLLNIVTKEQKLYLNSEDFIKNAQINNQLLKDLWKDVTNTDFLQQTDMI